MALLRTFPANCPAATVDYLLGRNRSGNEPDYRCPRVLIGDPDRFDAFVATIPFAQPVTALALSFEEQVREDRLTEHAESLVAALCAGIPRNEIEFLAVLHRERPGKKKRCLHLIVQRGAQDCTS